MSRIPMRVGSRLSWWVIAGVFAAAGMRVCLTAAPATEASPTINMLWTSAFVVDVRYANMTTRWTYFQVEVTGEPAPTLQWQRSTDGGLTWGNLTTGANALQYRVEAAAANEDGTRFRCVATNSSGSATSVPAVLSVHTPARVLTSPVSVNTLEGATVHFSVGVMGKPDVSYQWAVSMTPGIAGPWREVEDGPTYSGTNTAILAVVASAALSGAQYRCTVANYFGAVTSDYAGLRVLAPPVLTSQPESLTVTAGALATFRATAIGVPTPSVRWEVQTSASADWSPLVNDDTYQGTETTELTLRRTVAAHDRLRFRAVFDNEVGTAPSLPATLRVRGSILATPGQLHFSLKRTPGGSESLSTPAQDVIVGFDGAAGPWTVQSTVSWLTVSQREGVGPGWLRVHVVDSDTAVERNDTLTGALLLDASLGAGGVLSIPVTLVVSVDSVPSQTPFGHVDTPENVTTGVAGVARVTGWALDDIGVARVEIYRDCVPYEPQLNCQVRRGIHSVFVGEAASLPGARPDVEAAYPDTPRNNIAGWSYQLLTSVLPTREGPTPGQGSITIRVLAVDGEGQTTWLGERTLALDNDRAVVPFGTIDTPAPGTVVSNSLNNFGWALTPDRNATGGDPDDIDIGADGSTVVTMIDGRPIGHVTVNLCRGTLGHLLATGAYCDDDIAGQFGHAAPNPWGAVRFANPTRYRNLDAGRGAIGVFQLDTTTLVNGYHSIAWNVTDSLGRTSGIGARIFTVINGDSPMEPGTDLAGGDERRGIAGPGEGRLWGRSGYRSAGGWIDMRAARDRPVEVRVPHLERLELWFGDSVLGATLQVNGQIRPLPAGAALIGRQFTWAPPPGYFGTFAFRFRFVHGAADVVVRVGAGATVADMRPPLLMNIESVHVQGPTATIIGWARDRAALFDAGIGAVHVWGRRVGEAAAPTFLGVAQLDDCGSFSWTGLVPSGGVDLTAYVWLYRTGRWEDARTVRVGIGFR